MHGELPVVLFPTVSAWERWLRRKRPAPGVWMRIARKSAALASITYAEALDVALCHGWIDGQKRSYDEQSFLQKFTPRGARSIWSKINRDKADALIVSGRMQPAGIAAIERAKANGQWARAYDSHSTSTVPRDLQAALKKDPKAKAFFATLNSTNRYAVLWRIQTAIKPETRARRIQTIVAMLSRNETFHPQGASGRLAGAGRRGVRV